MLGLELVPVEVVEDVREVVREVVVVVVVVVVTVPGRHWEYHWFEYTQTHPAPQVVDPV